jgi:hypothetical protein
VRRFVENKLEVEGGRGHVEPPTAGVPCAHCMWKKNRREADVVRKAVGGWKVPGTK